MKESWIESRKSTALKEFEIARKELEARLARTTNSTEANVISGMLSMIEGGIRGVTSQDNPMPSWLVGVLAALAHPAIGSKYRKVTRILRQFDIEEIQNIPEEVIADLSEWEGDEDVGLFTSQAAHLAEELAREVDREYVKDLLAVVKEIADSRRDPGSDPANQDLARKWARLSDAIALAGTACDLLELDCQRGMTEIGSPNLPAVEAAVGHAARIRLYLCEARDCLEEKKDEERKARLPDGGFHDDPTLRGRDLYHNRIRGELKAKQGDFVVIDLRTGDYEVGESESEAWFKLRERRPDAFTWVERVGYPTPYRMAARPQVRS